MKSNFKIARSINHLAIAAGLLSGGQMLKAQQFQNLNFQGTWKNGSIPGWAATSYPYPGDSPSTYVQFDNNAIDASQVELEDSSGGGSWSFTPPGTQQAIQGNQSLSLQSLPDGRTASISQTGMVPTGTMSIDILAWDPEGEGTYENGNYTFPVYNLPPLNVTFDGSELILTPIATSSPTSNQPGGIVEYTANISAWAGTSGILSLGVDGFPASDNVENVPAGESWAQIGDVWFSDVPAPAIPEANSFAGFTGLMCLGIAGLKVRQAVKTSDIKTR